MRIIVFSDTHGNYSAMHKIFKRNGDADLFIFLGDGERDLDSPAVQVSRETASLQAMPILTLQRTVAYSVVTLTYNMLRA